MGTAKAKITKVTRKSTQKDRKNRNDGQKNTQGSNAQNKNTQSQNTRSAGGTQRRVWQQRVNRWTSSVLNTAADLILLELAVLGRAAAYRRNPGKLYQQIADHYEEAERIPLGAFKSQLDRLRRKGFVRSFKDSLTKEPLITWQGQERLKSLVPTYQESRVWDERVYLVTYDIPHKRNYQRDLLRSFLKQIGCGQLQQSVWVTPYDPRTLLSEFVEKNNLHGLVVVSDTGTNGAVGEMDLKSALAEIYGLDELNQRYREFVAAYKESRGVKKTKLDQPRVFCEFNAILRDDPQLPFELLPTDWMGDEAYLIYQQALEGTPLLVGGEKVGRGERK